MGKSKPCPRCNGTGLVPLSGRPAPFLHLFRDWLEGRSEFFAGEAIDAFHAVDRKEIYNALTYLKRTGELAHDGYGAYRKL